jgi:threonine/homoserine/homoserine lactone efflux protein
MLPILASVIVISFSGVMMPGPMFAVTLAKSYKSPWAGSQISLGHAVVEVPLILLIYFGFARFFENPAVQTVLSFAGGAMIVWLGVSMFLARKKVVQQGSDLPYSAFTAGITMSALNPFFLLWWATVGSLLILRFADFGLAGLGAFTLAHWLCDFLWLSLVSFFIYRTHRFLGPRFQEWLFIANSVFLAGFGIYFIVTGFMLLI